MKIAVIPGSFDPVTAGHLALIKKAADLFDLVYVSVLNNSEKKSLFSVEERKELLLRATGQIPNVRVDSFSGLLADYVKEKNAIAIVKGVRSAADFDYEFQMALINKTLAPQAETLFFPAEERYMAVHSSYVKEIAAYGGEIDSMVPEGIAQEVYRKIQEYKNN